LSDCVQLSLEKCRDDAKRAWALAETASSANRKTLRRKGRRLTETAFNTVIQRDRAIVIAAIIIICVSAWAFTLWLATQMGGIETLASLAGSVGMAEMGMDGMNAVPSPAFRPSSISDIAFISTMWAVMMVGMMTPSVTVMVVLHAAVARKAAASSRPLVATGWFLAGYLAAWIVFSFAACGAQWILTRFGLLTSMSVSGTFGGLVLIGAGLYPLKDFCLTQCQKPLDFLMRRGGIRLEPLGALRLGAVHGLYCVGCCWVLMALLFVGGIMNVLWIAGLTILIVMEKVAPTGSLIPRLAGALMVSAGLLLLAF
jgi:predicted metal-binding membrane protein